MSAAALQLAPVLLEFLDFFFLMIPQPAKSTLFPYTTLFRSVSDSGQCWDKSRCRGQALPDSHSAHQIFRSEEHTSELQSHSELVCRLLLEKKNARQQRNYAVSAKTKRCSQMASRAVSGTSQT